MNRIIFKFLIVMAFFCTYNTPEAATYTYDKLDRLIKVVYGSGSDGTLSYIEYTYDAAGNNTQKNSLGSVFYGDLDNNRHISLDDAAISLEVTAGQDPENSPVIKSEATGDKRIGIEDTVYILQKLSE
jgi:hypothetical protein